MRRILVIALVALAALGAVSIAGGAATKLKLQADPKGALTFDKKLLTAKAGTVTIVMSNPSPLPHNVAIKGSGVVTKKGKVVAKGGISVVTAKLKKGRYVFYCSVPGHAAAGMKGTLVVK